MWVFSAKISTNAHPPGNTLNPVDNYGVSWSRYSSWNTGITVTNTRHATTCIFFCLLIWLECGIICVGIGFLRLSSREAMCCLLRLPCHWQTGLVCSFIRWSFFTKGWIFIMLMGVWLSISSGTVRVLCTSVMSCWRKAWDGSHGEAGIVRIFSQMKIYGWSSHCFAGPYRILKKMGWGVRWG